MNIIKVSTASVNLGGDIILDGHQYPNGDFGISVTSASMALGFSREWLGRSVERSGNTFKALHSMGFSGEIKKVATPSIGGEQLSKSISLVDFNRLILYAASKGKKEAVALADALISISLNDFFRDAFNRRALNINEKRDLFYRRYSASMDWLKEDREDWQQIEEQEYFLSGEY